MESLVNKLKKDYPDFKFRVGEKFLFRYPKMIVFNSDEPNAELLLLHEVSHGLLGHRDYEKDVNRLKMEAEAWEKARELASKYGVDFNDNVAQDELDTYRNWLHKKSRCPKCGLTRFQDANKVYHCPRCENLY